MKQFKAILKIAFSLYMLLLAGSSLIHAQEITIKGKVSVEGKNKPPVGIITIYEVGEADYYFILDGEKIITSNHHTFVEKDGSYEFTIKKGSAIALKGSGARYYLMKKTESLKTSQTKDFVLKEISDAVLGNKPLRKNNPLDQSNAEEKKFDIHKKVKLSGTITDNKNRPLKDAVVQQALVACEDPWGTSSVLTNNDGKFNFNVQKGSRILFVMTGYQYQSYDISSDTIVNIKLKLENPF